LDRIYTTAEREELGVEPSCRIAVFLPGQFSCHVGSGERLPAFLVIHSLFAGSARGGIRMAPDISEDEVELLAEGMTLKFGLLGLPQGGAKAGIRADPEAPEEERFEILKQFGTAIAPLLRHRIYIPGPDMGTSNEMVRRMLVAQGVPVKPREMRGVRSGYFTALSVFSAARHAAEMTGLSLSGSTASIEGFGKVGSSLAQLLSRSGARTVAISTSQGCLYKPEGLNVADLLRGYREHGSRLVFHYQNADFFTPEKLFEVPVDLLCPCARHNSIQSTIANKILAKIICPGSNHPYDLQTERRLVQRRIVCLPYWITNCGGTLGETMEFAGWHDGKIAEFIHRRLQPLIGGVIAKSAQANVTPTEIAKPATLARSSRLLQQATHPTGLKGSLMAAGLECYRRGLVPSALTRALSRSYFEDNVLLPFNAEELALFAAH
jgi:glutamate dehydrogenase/leucine dehydrogenase